jgi:hypothetical protein
MTMKLTSLLAATLIAGSVTCAMAQGTGGGGTGTSGAGGAPATPQVNSGPGGPSQSTMAPPKMTKHKVAKRKHKKPHQS